MSSHAESAQYLPSDNGHFWTWPRMANLLFVGIIDKVKVSTGSSAGDSGIDPLSICIHKLMCI